MLLFVIVLALLIPLIAVVLDSQLGRALAARLERPNLPGEEHVGRRLNVLESEVERLARELQRLEDESQFVRALLEGKGTSDALPPPPPAGE